MRLIRRNDHSHQRQATQPIPCRNVFFFCEKNSGAAHFHLAADPNGRFPVDQAAGLLAMHCIVRGQTPSDYVVLVQAQNEILEDLVEKADKLLEAGKSVHCPLKMSRREEEVLAGVSDRLSNKEIASNLNLSERTVKFHVSSLLAKFRARGRMELARKVWDHSLGVQPMPPPSRETPSYVVAAGSRAPAHSAVNVVRLTERQMTA